jgi:hypothetical protein
VPDLKIVEGRVNGVAPRPDDFSDDVFLPAQVIDVRDGDVVRLDGRLWQVERTLGFAFVAREIPTGQRRQFGFATTRGMEKRVGDPLPVE